MNISNSTEKESRISKKRSEGDIHKRQVKALHQNVKNSVNRREIINVEQ